MKLSNSVRQHLDDGAASATACADALRTLVVMLTPMAPHVSAELWQRLGDGVETSTVPNESTVSNATPSLMCRCTQPCLSRLDAPPGALTAA